MSGDNHTFFHIKLVREGQPLYHQAISAPQEAAAFFRQQIGDSVQEHFIAIFLNARNIPIGWREISRGSVSASLVHPREVFLAAIKVVASSLILAHNHPSGDASPSKDDLELTRRLKQAGDILGLEVLDHLIITADTHVSLKEKGFL